MEDGVLSETRSKTASNAGKKTQRNNIKNQKFAKAKNDANSHIDIDIDIVKEYEEEGAAGEDFKTQKNGNQHCSN